MKKVRKERRKDNNGAATRRTRTESMTTRAMAYPSSSSYDIDNSPSSSERPKLYFPCILRSMVSLPMYIYIPLPLVYYSPLTSCEKPRVLSRARVSAHGHIYKSTHSHTGRVS